MPLPYGRLLHPRPALTNCKSCRTQHWELPQDAHKTQTYNICMTKHSYFPYTSTYSSMRHNTNRKHNVHHTPYTNILQHSRLKNTIFNNGYTTNIPSDPHTFHTADIKTNMRHIHTSFVSRHLATRGNHRILHTPPPHISSYEEIIIIMFKVQYPMYIEIRVQWTINFGSSHMRIHACDTEACDMCYVFNVNLTDSLMTDGLNAVWSNDRAAHTDTNPKNLELAPPQSKVRPVSL